MPLPYISLKNLCKRFGSLTANENVSLELYSGEVLALLGENGAGKTTLTKMLYGIYQPDDGEIFLAGSPVRFRSPADAIRGGVGFVSQHFSLVPSFTVAENIVLGREGAAILYKEALNNKVKQAAERFGLKLEPSALVRDLSVGEQQRVEILKALYRNCQLLILDEPTAVLTPQDVEKLFATLRHLQNQGLSVIIITHKLDEAMAISQRVAVLRLGKLVGVEATKKTSARELARLMVGRDTVPVTKNLEHDAEKTVALSAKNLTVKDKRGLTTLKEVSLELHKGEVLGIAGVAGNGQTELVDVLTGMREPESGSLSLNGKTLTLGNARAFEMAGVGRIPEDRLKGVVGDLSVAENLTLEHIPQFTQRGHLKTGAMTQEAERLISAFQIKAKATDKARTLSGGNIQKIILARTLSRNPSVVIAAQPTRGLDIGATTFVHEQLLAQKDRGAGVLLLSEDLDEILRLSDRILVMYGGSIVGNFLAHEANVETLGLVMAGSKHVSA
ncbi:MAG: ABC transporter ATP-binding protein [Trueperaceae bacterium]|nr:ABC transporter ATP-binding protein [Trueperaceae bacterium]